MKHVGYVLLTYGPKHTRMPLAARMGATPQIERIRRCAEKRRHEIGLWSHDYARSPAGPRSFPRLFALLAHAKEHDAAGLIILDDVTRLYRKLSADIHAEMFEALAPFHRYMIDARQRRLLSDLNGADWIAMLRSTIGPGSSDESTTRTRQESEGESTARARRVSQIVRAGIADRLARQIVELRDELSEAGRAPTHVELARVANERGLRTSRGNHWSDVTVGRALKRLADKVPADL